MTEYKPQYLTWTSKYNVEVKTVDTDGRIILDTQVNVFLNTKAKVPSGWEVVSPQLIFSDLKQEAILIWSVTNVKTIHKYIYFKLIEKVPDKKSLQNLKQVFWVHITTFYLISDLRIMRADAKYRCWPIAKFFFKPLEKKRMGDLSTLHKNQSIVIS